MLTSYSLCVLIVTYNSSNFIKLLIDSLLEESVMQDQIFIVDNASEDTTVDIIENDYKKIRLLKNNLNTGFASAVNMAMGKINGELVLLLNPDISINKGFVSALLRCYEKTGIEIISASEQTLINDTKFINPKIDFFGHPVYVDTALTNCFYQTGSALLFTKIIYENTDGLDSDFFLYFEEVDWFWRLHLLEIPFTICRDATYTHQTRGSSPYIFLDKNMFKWRNENCLMMLLKNYELSTLLWCLPIYLVINLIEVIVFSLLLRFDIAYTYIHGITFNIRMFRKTIGKRNIIQNKRKVSDNYIFRRMYHGSAKLKVLFELIKKSIKLKNRV